MVVDFDLDGDGKVTEEEINRKERMLEIELRGRKSRITKENGMGSYANDDWTICIPIYSNGV